jgi:hypothetical protein
MSYEKKNIRQRQLLMSSDQLYNERLKRARAVRENKLNEARNSVYETKIKTQNLYNERMKRARNAKAGVTNFDSIETISSQTITPKQSEEDDIDQEIKEKFAKSYGDMESGGVILHSNEIDFEDWDTNDVDILRKTQFSRGPTNFIERKLCSLGKKFGVQVVFEH